MKRERSESNTVDAASLAINNDEKDENISKRPRNDDVEPFRAFGEHVLEMTSEGKAYKLTKPIRTKNGDVVPNIFIEFNQNKSYCGKKYLSISVVYRGCAAYSLKRDAIPDIMYERRYVIDSTTDNHDFGKLLVVDINKLTFSKFFTRVECDNNLSKSLEIEGAVLEDPIYSGECCECKEETMLETRCLHRLCLPCYQKIDKKIKKCPQCKIDLWDEDDQEAWEEDYE